MEANYVTRPPDLEVPVRKPTERHIRFVEVSTIMDANSEIRQLLVVGGKGDLLSAFQPPPMLRFSAAVMR
jgi:hypothetical protein